MAGRGAQTFQKRQKEQQRKEKQQEKFAKRLERKARGDEAPSEDGDTQDIDLMWDPDAAPAAPRH